MCFNFVNTPDINGHGHLYRTLTDLRSSGGMYQHRPVFFTEVVPDSDLCHQDSGRKTTGSMDEGELENSARFRSERQDLHQRMKNLEKQEASHKLMKERAKARQKMEVARAQFDADLAKLEREASRLRAEMTTLQDQRAKELNELSLKIVELEEGLNKLNSEE